MSKIRSVGGMTKKDVQTLREFNEIKNWEYKDGRWFATENASPLLQHLSGKGFDPISMPFEIPSPMPTRTAARVKPTTGGQSKKSARNKRLSGSLITENWGSVTLNKPGLLGL